MTALWPQLEDPAWLAGQAAAGATAETIAVALACPVTTVRMALASHGLATYGPVTRRHRQAVPAGPLGLRGRALDRRLFDAAWLNDRYRVAGATIADIAAETGASPTDVRCALRGAGITQRRASTS